MKPLYPTLCTAALLMLAACTNDLAEDLQHEVPGTGTLPEGTFIVDYTADTDGAQTRADDDTKRPIQSLDYLLYEKTANAEAFTLKKHKTLTFDPDTQEWPLTRENLSWEHREALKDTLNTACQYKMVFVANAAASIWNEEVLENVTVGSSNFEDGRLVLPPRVFTENNMYYMWSNHDAPLDGESYGEGNPAKVAILLERMINKVEVRLDEEAISDENGSIVNFIKSIAKGYYTEMTQPDGIVYDDIYQTINDLPDQLKVSTSAFWQYSYPLSDLKDYLTNNISTIVKDKIIPYIRENDSFYSTFTTPIISNFQQQCNWESSSYIKITYTNSHFPNQINFERKTIATTGQDTHKYVINDNTFTYFIFGNNEAEGGETIVNEVSSFLFFNNEEQTTPIIEIKGTDYPIADYEPGGNQHIIYECNPIGKRNSESRTEMTITINLVDALELEKLCNDGDWLKIPAGTKGTFDGFLAEIKSSCGIDLSQVTFDIEVYDIKVSPSWEKAN